MQAEFTTSAQTLRGAASAGHSPGIGVVPLFYAAWLFAAGIAVAHFVWLGPSVVLVALAAVALLCCVTAQRALRVAWLPMMVLWCLLGVWCAEMEPHPAPAPALAALSDGLLRTVEGTVVNAGSVRGEMGEGLNDDGPDSPTSSVAEQQPEQSIDLRVSSLEVITDGEDSQSPVAGGIRLSVRWPAATNGATKTTVKPFECGERIRAVVRLLPPEVYHDASVWSREDYLLDQGITSTGTVSIERVDRLGASAGAPLACRAGSLQHSVTERLLTLPAAMDRLPAPLRLTQDDAVMLTAMVTGDRSYLTHSLRAGFERTGSFHMLVVSGFHLAIVAAFVFWIARRLRLPRVPATLLTLLVSFAYALFTGFGTPAQRSLWMVSLYLLGRLLYRERSALNTIGFAALCLLAASPRSLFDASLQMTLLAVVAIAGIAAPLLEGTIHPYFKASRGLNILAIDAKLPPRLAQFRVMLRMMAVALARRWRQIFQDDYVARFPLEGAFNSPDL
jgi:competence protein ComEC